MFPPPQPQQRRSPRTVSHLTDLPIDLLRHSFSFLDLPDDLLSLENSFLNEYHRSALVCALNGMIVKNISVDDEKSAKWIVMRNILAMKMNCRFVNIFIRHLLLESRRVVEVLDLEDSSRSSDKDILDHLGHFPNLKVLSVSSWITFNLNQFLSLNNQLISLKFHSINNNILSHDISAISSCTNMISLSLTGRWVTDQSLKPLILALPKLEELEISSIELHEHQTVTLIIQSLQKLRSLSISWCGFSKETCLYYLIEYVYPRINSPDSTLRDIGLLGCIEIFIEVF